MAAAIGGSAEAFSTKTTPTAVGGAVWLLGGPMAVGDTITLGSHDVAAALGSPDNPDTAFATGTWDDSVPNVLSKTDPTTDGAVWWMLPLPSIEYIIQADIRIPTGQNAGTTAAAMIAAGNGANPPASTGDLLGEGAGVSRTGTGDGAGITAQFLVDGVHGAFPVAMAQDEWHTLRGVVSPDRQLVYLDGVFVMAHR